MIFKDANGNVTNQYIMSGDATIKMTEPPEPRDTIRLVWKPFYPPEVVEWYSKESDYGWIDSETADRIFPNGTWDQLGYKTLAEYTTPYGLVFTYIKKK